MTFAASQLKRAGFLIAASILFYAALRIPLMNRDLTFEEPIWLGAGIRLATDFSYNFYYGELDPRFSAFHKPPLLSALLGLFYSVFGSGTNAALRAFPFAIGLANFIIALLCVKQLEGSIARAAVLYLALPYLIVCGYYIQIDPTVGLFGYLLLLLGSLLWVGGQSRAIWLFGVAGVWLTLSKTEIFIIGGAALSLGLLPYILRSPKLLLAIIVYTAGGAAGVGLNRYFSYLVTGSSEGFLQIYHTIIQAVGGIPISGSGSFADRMANAYASIWDPISYFGLQWILLAGLVGFALSLFGQRNAKAPKLTILMSFALVPVAVYGFGGYVGGAFPRTVVIAVVPLLIAASAPTVGIVRSSISWILVGLVVLSNLPLAINVYKSPAAWTEFRGLVGFKDVAEFLKQKLPAGTPILANDPVGFYYKGPYYDYALIEAYPDRLAKLINSDISDKLGAWVYFSGGEEYSATGRMAEFYKKLKSRCQVERTEHIGTMNIALLTPPRC